MTLALSMTGLQLGTHLGEAILSSIRKAPSAPTSLIPHDTRSNTTLPRPNPKPALPPPYWTPLDGILIVICVAIWVGMIIAAVFTPETSRSSWRHVTLGTCFAPAGAILRWYLSRFNSRVKSFPVGTFAANIGGSIFLAAIVCLQHTPAAGGKSPLACQVLGGLQDGFCGKIADSNVKSRC